MSEKVVYLISHHNTTSYPCFEPMRYEKITSSIEEFHKIGVAAKPERRLSSMASGTPHELEIQNTIESSNPKELESQLHSLFWRERHNGEWFDLFLKDIASLKGFDKLEPEEIKQVRRDSDVNRLETSLYVEVHKRRGEND